MRLEFGDPKSICIYCEVTPSPTLPRNLWMGKVLIIIDDSRIGNLEPEFSEQIGIAILTLAAFGRYTGTRRNTALQHLEPVAVLESVMQSVYGDGSPDTNGSLRQYELLPSVTGPAFDNWRAVSFESELTETFIWKHHNDETVQKRTFPIGTMWRVAEEAYNWMQQTEQSRDVIQGK